MKKGVINTVEVLILIMIFLAAAAFFASFYLNATKEEAKAVQKQVSATNLLLNPPVKIIGVISIENGTLISTSSDTSDDPNVVAFACIQETSGGKWWVSSTGIRLGTQGPMYSVLDHLDQSAKIVVAVGKGDLASTSINITKIKENITKVAFSNTTSLLAVCYDVSKNKILNVYAFTQLSCDQEVLNDTVKKATQWCYDDIKNYASGDYFKVYFVDLFEYSLPGSVSIVPSPVLPKNIVNKGGTFTMVVNLAQSFRPNPAPMLEKKNANALTFDDIVKWLRSTNNVTTALGVFKAVCESCTFYIG